MLIVVEGPDGSGKSTLAAILRARLPGTEFVSMLGGRTGAPEVVRSRAYQTIYRAREGIILCERFHPISDTIYRTIDRKPRIFTRPEVASFMDELSVTSSLLLYCRPPLPKDARHLVAKGDDDPDWMATLGGSYTKVWRGYDLFMFGAVLRRVRVINYDFTAPWAPEVIEEIIACVG